MAKKQYRECSVEWCDRTSTIHRMYKYSGDGKVYCDKHYRQLMQYGEIKSQYKINEFGGIFDKEYGYSNQNELNKRTNELWYNVLRRSKSDYYKNTHPTYKDVTVDDSWLLFSNFERDIQTLEGYELWKENTSSEYHLDKDIKIPGNKCYCKEACTFVSAAKNKSEMMERNNPNPGNLIIRVKDDNFKIYKSSRKANADGFNRRSVSNACKNNSEYRGYRWYYYEDLPLDIKEKVDNLL